MDGTDDKVLEAIRSAVTEHGLAPTAKRLGMPISTVSSILIGRAREGSVLLALKRWRALSEVRP